MHIPKEAIQKAMVTTRVEDGWRAWYAGEEQNVVSHRNREEAMRLLKELDEKRDKLLPASSGELPVDKPVRKRVRKASKE